MTRGNLETPGNVVTVIFWLITVILLGVGIGFPAAAGNLGIIMGIGNDPTVITGDLPLQATQSIGLAVLAAALSGIVIWFGRPSAGSDSGIGIRQDNVENRMMRHLGISFLMAAFCFTLFAGLSQIIPDVRDRTDLWSTAIRYSAGIFAISGSVLLSFTALWGLLELIWRGIIAAFREIFK